MRVPHRFSGNLSELCCDTLTSLLCLWLCNILLTGAANGVTAGLAPAVGPFYIGTFHKIQFTWKRCSQSGCFARNGINITVVIEDPSNPIAMDSIQFYSNQNAYAGWYVLMIMMITVCVHRRQSRETFIEFRSTPRINFMKLRKLCICARVRVVAQTEYFRLWQSHDFSLSLSRFDL